MGEAIDEMLTKINGAGAEVGCFPTRVLVAWILAISLLAGGGFAFTQPPVPNAVEEAGPDTIKEWWKWHHERLKKPEEALILYKQVASDYKDAPVAKQAQQDADRLTKAVAKAKG